MDLVKTAKLVAINHYFQVSVTTLDPYERVYSASRIELQELYEKGIILPWNKYADWELTDIRDEVLDLVDEIVRTFEGK